MLGTNGGLLGKRREPNRITAPGLWFQNEQSIQAGAINWPTMGDPYFSGTVILAHFDGTNGSTTFVNSGSIPGATLSRYTGDSTIIDTSFQKFGTGSMSTGRISTGGANDNEFDNLDFTIEFWVYLPSIGSWNFMQFFPSFDTFSLESDGRPRYRSNGGSNYITGTTPLVANTWHHLAYTRFGTEMRIYLDGQPAGSPRILTTTSNPLGNSGYTIGSNGIYIDEFRLTLGKARYTGAVNFTPQSQPFPDYGALYDYRFAQVALLLQMNGPNDSTTTTDSSNYNNIVTFAGDAAIKTTQKKYGTASCYFGGGGYLSIPGSSNLALISNNEWTIEAWIYPTDVTGTKGIICSRVLNTTSSGTWSVNLVDGSVKFVWNYATNQEFSGGSVSANQWSHIAVVRYGGTVPNHRIYLNGIEVANTNSSATTDAVAPIYIGATASNTSATVPDTNFFSGYIDDIRITIGRVRYTAAFTPPTSQHLLGVT